MPSKRRYLVFVTVLGSHALVLGLLFGRSRTGSVPTSAGIPITAFIVKRPRNPRSPGPRPRMDDGAAPITPIVAPVNLAAPIDSITTGPGIDWQAAAGRSAGRMLEHRKRISFGFPPGGKSAITPGVPSPSTPAHYAGESDRTIDGRDTEWTSANCYVVSDPPLPGEPDFLKHARLAHFGCIPPPGPDPGELFKSLPAYKKYHPQ